MILKYPPGYLGHVKYTYECPPGYLNPIDIDVSSTRPGTLWRVLGAHRPGTLSTHRMMLLSTSRMTFRVIARVI